VLNAGGKLISSVQHAVGSATAIITMDGDLEGGDVGVEVIPKNWTTELPK